MLMYSVDYVLNGGAQRIKSFADEEEAEAWIDKKEAKYGNKFVVWSRYWYDDSDSDDSDDTVYSD